MSEHIAKRKFRWDLEEFQIVGESLKTVRFKATVLKPGMSRNGRLYLPQEILEAGRTLAQKPIDVNHDKTRIRGNTDWASVNKNTGNLEVSGVVNKEPEASMLRLHDPKITGWSVEADFLAAECNKCHKRFEDMNALKKHLIEDELFKNFDYTPRDLLFTGLAIVEEPQEPGVAGAVGYQLEETAKFGTREEFWKTITETYDKSIGYASQSSQLAEKLTNQKEEQEKMANKDLEGKVATEKPTMIPWNIDKLKETPTKTEPVKVESAKPEALPVKEEKLKLAEPCSPELQACVDALIADGKDEESAWAICRSKIGETITLTVKESANLPKLEFIPEGSIYENFDVCVAAGNSRKECAAIFDGIEERNNANRKIVEGYNKIIDLLNSPTVIVIPKETRHDNLATKESVDKVSKLVSTLPKDDITWQPTEKELKETVDKLTKKMDVILEMKTEIDTVKAETKKLLQDQVEQIKTLMEATPKDDLSWKELKIPPPYDDQPLKKSIEVLEKRANDEFATYKKDLLEYWKPRVDKLEAALKDSEAKKVKETEDLTTRVDNVEDKLKGTFKGKAKEVAKTGTEEPENPLLKDKEPLKNRG